jgi:hypothetical protein
MKKEYRFTITEGRKWATLHIEAMQNNDPRYQRRRERFDITDPCWGAVLGGFIAGFVGAPLGGEEPGEDGEDPPVMEPPA